MSRASDRRHPELTLPMGATEDDFLASMTRLQTAGLIERVIHDRRTSSGEISFTPAALILLQAGRDPFTEPEFLAAWIAGDAAAVRAWVQATADKISIDEPR